MPFVVFSKCNIYDSMEVGMHENDAITYYAKTSFFNFMIINQWLVYSFGYQIQ